MSIYQLNQTKSIQMPPSFLLRHCSSCDCAVQQREQSSYCCLPGSSLQRTALFSSRFDSDDFAYYCRGQGVFYSDKSHPHSAPDDNDPQDHFNFSGLFSGLCCFCARMQGFYHGPFVDIACYHCKRRLMVLEEFGKLKKSKKDYNATWAEQGWTALPDSIIDTILRCALGEQALISFQ